MANVKLFRDLELIGPAAARRAALDGVPARSARWTRDVAAEAGLSKESVSYVCFQRTEGGRLPPARLVLVDDGVRKAEVVNVRPVEQGAFTFDEYNDIVGEFAALLQSTEAGPSLIEVRLGQSSLDPTEQLSEQTAALLKQFSRLANRGGLHARDRERFQDFVLAAHRNRDELEFEELRQWLEDEERWPSPVADALASDYSNGRALLARQALVPA